MVVTYFGHQMRIYLLRVLELTKPYRGRLVLGLLCGFLSGALAFTLGLSLKLAVDAVFPVQNTDTLAYGVPARDGLTNASVAAAPGQTFLNAAPGSTSAGPATTTNAVASAPAGKSKKNLASRVPAPLKRWLDGLNQWVNPPGAPSTTRKLLIICLIPATMLLRSGLAYLNIYLLAWVGIRAANDLRVRLFQHVVNLPLGFFSRASTGDLVARFEGALQVNSTVKDSFGVIIREPISIVTLVIALVALEPVLSIFTLMVFPICLLPIIIFGRKFRKSDSGVHSKFANLHKVMHESFTGIRVIKAYNLEDLVTTDFRRATQGVVSFFMRAIRAGELPGPMIEFIGSIGVALVFSYFAFAASGRAPVGDMFAYFFMVFSLYAPLKNLSRLQHQLTMAKVCVDPVYDLLSRKSTLPEPANPKPLSARRAEIRFENVSFSYGDKAVLQNINLAIKPGQLVALVGRTGSGKTSIANLLLRFYDPQKGAVLIGDTDIRTVSSKELRDNIAVVTQETILFNDTIRYNIAMGRQGATEEEIKEAAKHAYADGFIAEKPKAYDTMVGEKGVNISGGQRQRIAIARAILKNAPILILDEATNALDTESERIVQKAIEELMEGRTTICIAHRLSTIKKADVIVVLDSGKIVETGTHDSLMQARGLYSKLYELQYEVSAPA